MKRYDVAKLRIDSIRQKCQNTVGGRFRPLLDHPETRSLNANETWLRIKQSFKKQKNKNKKQNKTKNKKQKKKQQRKYYSIQFYLFHLSYKIYKSKLYKCK